jgi:predicted aldo/keto reductase-like oxidoreductase
LTGRAEWATLTHSHLGDPAIPLKIIAPRAAHQLEEPIMQHRRFGRTELQMPVFSCGGMRYQKSWARDADIDDENQQNLEATIRRALEVGINHIETARGYGTSELQLGRIIPQLPRDEIILQTQVGPTFSKKEFQAEFEKALFLLGVERLDLLGIHGINDDDAYDMTFNRGCLEAALEYKAQGRVGAVGFSTHGPTDLIVKTIESGQFDYVNLHWFYIMHRNWPAVEAATKRDMGVFIISPNDKGGKLYEPPEKLVELCRPLSPMQFNDLYSLSIDQVHTLSIGAVKPTDFDEHIAGLEHWDNRHEVIGPIRQRLDQTMNDVLGADWVAGWSTGLPRWQDTPGGINLESILWLWNLTKAFDMTAYGQMRYNLLGQGDSWFAGQRADKLAAGEIDEAELLAALGDHPFKDRIIDILKEADDLLGAEAVKRLSESEN